MIRLKKSSTKLLIIVGVLALILFGYRVIVFVPHYSAEFQKLEQAKTFASKMPEFPDADNKDWFNPDYSTFFKQSMPSLFKHLMYKLGIEKPYWSPISFKNIISNVYQKRLQQGFTDNCIQKITPDPGSVFVIWGNLQGAFHSLTRDLQELKDRRVIDENLHIIDPDYYFIFTGNVISRSPYSLETLMLVLQLMNSNPERVIYIRGTHESDQLWQDFDMHYALRIRLWWQVRRHTPLETSINQFFETLPRGLYLVGHESLNDVEVVRIANKYSFSPVDLMQVGDLFSNKDKTIWYLDDKIPSTKRISIVSTIISNFTKTNHYVTDGLRLLFPDEQGTVWGVLSSPTSSYRNRFNFTNDAFVLLNTVSEFDQWTLQLCNQHVDTLQGFDCFDKYNLLKGFIAIREFQPTGELVVGSSIDLSSVFQRFGEYLVEGMQARIQDQNVEGGIDGITIKLLVKDDAYEPIKAQENVDYFLSRGIDILLAPFGTPTIEAFMDKIRQKKILALFPTGGNRQELLDYLVYYRVSLAAESQEIVTYALDTLKSQKIAFLFPNDSFGIGSFEAAQKTLDDRGFSSYESFSYKRNTLEFALQANRILEYNPDTFALFCPTIAAREFIRQFGLGNFAGDFVIGKSGLNTHKFERFLEQSGLTVTVPAIVPNPHDLTLAITKQYQESMKRHNVDINSNSFEGYIVASIFVDVLKRIQGAITKDAIVSAIENIKDENLGGIPINFDPKTRQLSHTLWIAQIPEQNLAPWKPVQVE